MMWNKQILLVLMVGLSLSGCHKASKEIVYWDETKTSKKIEGMELDIVEADGEIWRVQHGKWKTWHSNGQQASEIVFNRGTPQGVWRFWHENGQLAQVVPYNKQGRVDGEIKWWDENGKLIKTSSVEDGSGSDYYFGDNGAIRRKIKYINGIPQSEQN